MVNQYDIYWINLDPTIGSEINKIRPCLIISPNESNKHLSTILVAPITSTIRNFPMRVNLILDKKNGQIALDQIRCVDKFRLKNIMETLSKNEIKKVKSVLKQYLID